MTVLKFSILLMLINAISCHVYYITPDDGYCDNNIPSHHCDNLHNYLLNASKYFTAYTQMNFLPGIHYISTNLSIENVHNISLVGGMANGIHTTIQCSDKQLFIIMTNITQLTMKDMVITGCGENNIMLSHVYAMRYHYGLHTIQLYQCSDVTMQNITILPRTIYGSLISINTMGHLMLYDITSAGVTLVYNDYAIKKKLFDSTSVALIDNFQYICPLTCPPSRKITIMLNQSWFNVHVNVMNTKLCFPYYITSIYIFMTPYSHSVIKINQCTCTEVATKFYATMTLFEIQDSTDRIGKGNSMVQIKNCHFTDINSNKRMFILKTTSSFAAIHIIDSSFMDINNVTILDSGDMYKKEAILIRNTSFTSISSPHPLVHLTNQLFLLEGPVLFKGVKLTGNYPLFDIFRVGIHIYNYVEISNCSSVTLTPNNSIYVYIGLIQPATVNFTRNNIRVFTNPFFDDEQLPCIFQFFSDRNLNLVLNENVRLNFSIIFNANQWVIPLSNDNLVINHCIWLPGSAFNTTLPVDVNRHIITFVNESFIDVNKSLCYCSDKDQIDCLVDELGPIYPGQTLNIMLAYPNGYDDQLTALFVDVYDSVMLATACKVSSLQDANQYVGQTCTQLDFTIMQINDYYKWCELSFKLLPFDSRDGYYIKFYPCPAGFMKLDGKCQCDPILKPVIIDNCDINDQTITRPANSWISAKTTNDSHIYLISLNCPFDYCIPDSSHLKLSSTIDLQCQHRRSDLLCGQCSDGLSTVFGSSYCQQCSNANLYIVVPIALSGILLVVLLFFLNLTVADGTINAFILYVNIVSINSTILFPSHDTTTSTMYTFVSLANLDMGIKMCFYNGMDDYAKMWLQLLYPLYLILIAAVLIIASRYSTKIQRLTAHRALPVLATLFLLSYTKILHTVSSVLFSYSTITHLPNSHTILVWSVDANVNISGIKFIALFIICLILFLLLIPFNITLLFTRTLSRFRIVNYFKPLLDVYQAPYKDNFYYWTGLHLVIKAMFFAISALDDTTNLTISIIILCAMEGFVGYSCPFKHRLQNLQEMILLLNLNILFVVVLSGQSVIFINTMVALVAVHFTFIVIYHIVNYTLGAKFKSKVNFFIIFVFEMMTRKWRRMKSMKNKIITPYSNEIPEITYNYSEYQEPLVGEDYM